MTRSVLSFLFALVVLAGCATARGPDPQAPGEPRTVMSEALDLAFEVPDARWRAHARPVLRGTHVRPQLVLRHAATRAVLAFAVTAEDAGEAEATLRRQAEAHPSVRKVIDMPAPEGRRGFFVLYRDGGSGLVAVEDHPRAGKGRVILQGYSPLAVDEPLLGLVRSYFASVRGM